MNSPFIPDEVIDLVEDLPGTDPRADEALPSGDFPDDVTERMPTIWRILSLQRVLVNGGRIHNRAVLFHERCTLSVDWLTQQVDTRLHRYGLALIRHAKSVRSTEGAVRIERLLPADRPQPDVNLFDTIPHGWTQERDLVRRARDLWQDLPRPLAHLVNAVLWESGRFHRFAMGPSSLQGHHNGGNGNLRHSVEVAELARDIGRRTPLANVDLLVAAGLLHDAAKADEYRYDRERRQFRLSDRGALVGHRDTLIEWLAVARELGRVVMPNDTYLSLLHLINAAKGAPAWLGLREPRCLEAEILSMADRLSGQEDLHTRCAPADGYGFGRYHPQLGRRSYLTRKSEPG